MTMSDVPLPKDLPEYLAALGKIKAYDVRNEAALQDKVASMMPGEHVDIEQSAGLVGVRISMGGDCWQWEKEKAFSKRDRIDFCAHHAQALGTLTYGIECKVKAGGMATWRQLERYAEHVDVLVLLTIRPMQFNMPFISVPGKRPVPVIVFELWKNL